MRVLILLILLVSLMFGLSEEEVKKMTATIINLNGHLCAKVLEIRPLAVKNDMYEVTCIEYRSGSKTKVYHMDAKKGFAWKP